jgi:hypothetical protein
MKVRACIKQGSPFYFMMFLCAWTTFYELEEEEENTEKAKMKMRDPKVEVWRKIWV